MCVVFSSWFMSLQSFIKWYILIASKPLRASLMPLLSKISFRKSEYLKVDNYVQSLSKSMQPKYPIKDFCIPSSYSSFLNLFVAGFTWIFLNNIYFYFTKNFHVNILQWYFFGFCSSSVATRCIISLFFLIP